MLRSISSTQLVEWLAFSMLEPFDEERQDIRVASVVSAIYNVHRDAKKRPEPYSWKDGMIGFGDYVRKAVKPDWRVLKAKLRAIYDANVKAHEPRRKRRE